MRRPIVWALFLTLLTAGCALPVEVDGTKQVKQRAPEAAAPAEEPPAEEPPAEEPPPPAAEDFTGTTWAISYVDPVLGSQSNYDITFQAGGVMFDGDPNDTTTDNDSWEQVGTTIIFYFNDAYAVYTGELSSPGVLTGTATNVVAANWSWTAVLQN